MCMCFPERVRTRWYACRVRAILDKNLFYTPYRRLCGVPAESPPRVPGGEPAGGGARRLARCS
eukprot:1886788-Prymnesium_polylepis.1